MALKAKDTTYEDVRDLVDGFLCKSSDAVCTAEQPRCCFTLASFPMDELASAEISYKAACKAPFEAHLAAEKTV